MWEKTRRRSAHTLRSGKMGDARTPGKGRGHATGSAERVLHHALWKKDREGSERDGMGWEGMGKGLTWHGQDGAEERATYAQGDNGLLRQARRAMGQGISFVILMYDGFEP